MQDAAPEHPNSPEASPEARETWYARNKRQVQLIQYLLYHLQKHSKRPQEQKGLVKKPGDFNVGFE